MQEQMSGHSMIWPAIAQILGGHSVARLVLVVTTNVEKVIKVKGHSVSVYYTCTESQYWLGRSRLKWMQRSRTSSLIMRAASLMPKKLKGESTFSSSTILAVSRVQEFQLTPLQYKPCERLMLWAGALQDTCIPLREHLPIHTGLNVNYVKAITWNRAYACTCAHVHVCVRIRAYVCTQATWQARYVC